MLHTPSSHIPTAQVRPTRPIQSYRIASWSECSPSDPYTPVALIAHKVRRFF